MDIPAADAPHDARALADLPADFWAADEWSPEHAHRLRQEFVAADRPAEPAETAEQACSTREFAADMLRIGCGVEVRLAHPSRPWLLEGGQALTPPQRRSYWAYRWSHGVRRTRQRVPLLRRTRRRGAGRPRGRRSCSRSPGGRSKHRSTEGEPGEPPARYLTVAPQATIYTFGCLSRERRGEA